MAAVRVFGILLAALSSIRTARGDCVSFAQYLDDGGKSPCKMNGGWGSGSFKGQAPYVMSLSCSQLKAELEQNRPPTQACCAELIKFLGWGCSCEKNLRETANFWAKTDMQTFYAIGRVTQLQCGYGQVYDPCTQNWGTC